MKVVGIVSVAKTLIDVQVGKEFIIKKSTNRLRCFGIVEGRKITILSRHKFLICKVCSNRMGLSLDLSKEIEVF